MALAKSPTDNSPAIIHGVFSHTSATKAYDKMLKDRFIPERIKGERHVQVLRNCPSPEDPTKLRDVTIEVILVDETSSVDDVSSLRGQTDVDEDVILSLNFFGNDDLRDDVDATIVMGNFCKEDGHLAPKLLCHRFSSMIANSLSLDKKNHMTKDIYRTLRGIAGKRGYEMWRFGGSSGIVDHETDRNLLRILCEHEGSLPRTVPGYVLIRDVDKYHVI